MKTLLLALLLILLPPGVAAQSAHPAPAVEQKMILTGVVYDVNGAVIVTDIKLVARSGDGKRYATATNDEGFYQFELPLGLYRIEVAANGFCNAVVERFRVINSTHGKMSLDFVLEVAPSHGGCQREIIIEKKPKTDTKKKSRPLAE